MTDHLTERLEQLAADGAPGWQCEAAAVVVVLSEFLFGASGAWVPKRWLGAASSPAEQSMLVAAVDAVQTVLVLERLWGVQTQDTGDDLTPTLTPQVCLWPADCLCCVHSLVLFLCFRQRAAS